MKKSNVFSVIAITILIATTVFSCSQIKQITQTLTDLQKLQFKLDSVTGFQLAGVGLNNKSSISSFSVSDGLKLTQAFASKSLPADFTLNVAAKNPNDGTSGSKKTTATISKLVWQLYIDDVQTVNGVVTTPLSIPGSGQTTNIPLSMNLDLYKFFQNKNYEGLVNLALQLGGVNASPARLKLDITPTVSTSLGAISMGKITVVNTEFR